MDLSRWRAVLGEEHVEAAPEVRATMPVGPRTLAVLRPADRAQVQACVRIAAELGIAIHPVSRGQNLGYGSRTPARDAVVLDLARLDRIVDFDERLAYATVEPGVTFRQLSRYLRGCRARVFASVTGGPADGSVVANALERGDGAGPYGDRFAYACALEVVLPDGACIETGFGRFGGAIASLARWGVGPALDGVFSQSGLGIVTRMTVWLVPYPKHLELGWYTLDDAARLPRVIDALRRLRLAGVTTATTPLWNDVKALTLVTRFPWAEAVPPLPAASRAKLCAQHQLGRWNGTVSLYGQSTAHIAALRELVMDELGPIAFRAAPEDPLDAPDDACGPALGVPHDRNLASVYWRMPERPDGVARSLDPDRDGCGFIWLGHAVPFDGEHARAAAELAESELEHAGFEPIVALLGVTERALQLVASISYDRAIAGEDDRAMACHDGLFAALTTRGYPTFRLGAQSRGAERGQHADYDRLVDAIAHAIDPRGVFSRERDSAPKDQAAPTTSSRR